MSHATEKLVKQTLKTQSFIVKTAGEERLAEIRQLQGEMQAAIKAEDSKKLSLLNIRIKALLAEGEKYQLALVDQLKALKDSGSELGVAIDLAEKSTPEEIANLSRAEAELKQAERELSEILAHPPIFFAEKKTKALREQVETAKSRLEMVKVANIRAATARLNELDIDAASQRLIRISTDAQESVRLRLEKVQTEIDSVVAEIDRVQEADADLARRLEEATLQVEQSSQRVADAEVDLSQVVPGTEEYSNRQRELQLAKDAEEIAKNKRDAVMEVKNQIQVNLENSKIHLTTQRKLSRGLDAFMQVVEEQRNGLVVQYKSRVEAARALADLKFAADVNATGNAVMDNFAEYMAKAGAAADEEVAEMAEAQPEAVRAAREKIEIQIKASEASQKRIDEVFAEMERDYKVLEEKAAV